MKRDPICGMQGTIERHGRWFCSEGCAAKFLQESARHFSRFEKCLAVLRDPWVWVPLSGLALATAGSWWPSAAGAGAIYTGYLKKVVVPLLIGLLLGGLIDHFVPREYIVRLLAEPKKRVIARATLLGFLASTCSHGCLALSLELYRKGASVPAVVSFLLASPWASMSLTLMLLSLFGATGLVIIACSLAIAFATGLIFQRLARRGLIDPPTATAEVADIRIWEDVRRRVRGYPWTAAQLAADARGVLAGMAPLGRMVLGWVQLGLVLSAALGAVVPHEMFMRWLGPSPLGLLLTLAFATVMEVCSEGTSPLAFELYRHTGALGNAFAFLMGGVVTDYTELGAVWTTIGWRTVLWMLLVTLPLVLAAGLILNFWRV
jgi:uncharacterized membrane protein YraQ (UPF0718 family)